MAKNLFQFRNPLTFSGSSGFTVNNPGVNITGVDRKDFVFSIGQDVSSTSDVVFNQVTPDKIIIGYVWEKSTGLTLAGRGPTAEILQISFAFSDASFKFFNEFSIA